MTADTSLLLAAAIGGVCLAVAAALWALAARRARPVGIPLPAEDAGGAAWSDAFAMAVMSWRDGQWLLDSGEDALAACAGLLGVEPRAGSVMAAIAAGDDRQARRLSALTEMGEPCDFKIAAPGGVVMAQGRAQGAVAWLMLRPGAPDAAALAPMASAEALVGAFPGPAYLLDPAGRTVWANGPWLSLARAATVEEAEEGRTAPDFGAAGLVQDALASGARRDAVRWTSIDSRRRAFQVVVEPLAEGAAAVFVQDVTEAEETREALRLHVEAHDETLNRLADAVAIFSPAKRLVFHNTAFAELWGMEQAWLEEGPTHAEVLDRLRQRRRLPETVDYAQWKAKELDRYGDREAGPDDLWVLPDGRTLRVTHQPRPLGGMLVLFSDVTGELRMKAQYNGLIQVQQATLDKLNDAVAVFGSDGRLRLHNEAFERFWNVTGANLDDAGDFDGVAELCLARLHDMQFWRDLKARVTDPDPQARIPTSGELRTSDKRIVAFQSRPLPDGATLTAFTDVTDTRELEQALADRSNALSEAERLKRDFVGNVSYELRTPLTTILGYSELLEGAGESLSDRARSHVAAVRTAASQLARSIDDVLDMAQIDAGEMALDLGDVDIARTLADAAERWSREAADNRVQIVVACDPDVGVIRGDRRRLDQTLDHLTENAVRQSPPDARVTLTARRTLGEVQVQVTDTGRGIPFHVQAHIFDRFVGRDRGGPGLGLALVKSLVELHGGWVALESEPGKGATFTCHLPETAQAAAAQPELKF